MVQAKFNTHKINLCFDFDAEEGIWLNIIVVLNAAHRRSNFSLELSLGIYKSSITVLPKKGLTQTSEKLFTKYYAFSH